MYALKERKKNILNAFTINIDYLPSYW